MAAYSFEDVHSHPGFRVAALLGGHSTSSGFPAVHIIYRQRGDILYGISLAQSRTAGSRAESEISQKMPLRSNP